MPINYDPNPVFVSFVLVFTEQSFCFPTDFELLNFRRKKYLDENRFEVRRIQMLSHAQGA